MFENSPLAAPALLLGSPHSPTIITIDRHATQKDTLAMTNAVVTLLYNAAYLPGALVLAIALRKLPEASRTRLAVLIDLDLFSVHQLDLLRQFYDDLIPVEPIKSRLHDRLTQDLGRPELDKTFTKIQLWSLDYEKVLYLDSDTLPAVPENSQTSVLSLLDLDFPQNKVLAAPDSGFPDIFNSGVFLLKPNTFDYTNLVKLVHDFDNYENISFDGADQGLLNQYFNSDPDWVSQLLSKGAHSVTLAANSSSNWISIPFLYNTTPSSQYEYLPAFKYFSKPPGSGPESGSGVSKDDSFGQLAPTLETSNKYHYTAYSHFKGQSQIKLVHFIGPHKPWNASAEGIFTDWWQLWNDQFGNKAIADVIYEREYKINVKKLLNPFLEPEQGKSLSYEVVPLSAPQQHRPFVPADLCDPQNYQHIPDNVVQTADSQWDPTREAPPAAEPHHQPTSALEEGIKSFTSTWDDTQNETTSYEKHENHEIQEDFGERQEPVQAYVQPEVIREPESTPAPGVSRGDSFLGDQPQEDRPEETVYGYHRSQQAERVFDDEYDYEPSHFLREQLDPETSAPDKKLESLTQQIEELTLGSVDKALEKLSVGGHYEEEEEEEEDETEEAEENRNWIPKIFPWEFRQQQLPERSFD